jgi:signal transduction histidine kinase
VSIRLRLAAVFTLATLVLVGIGGYVYLRQLHSGLEDSLDQSLQARAGTVATALGSDPSTRLPNGADGYVQVYNIDGQLLRSSRALAGEPLLTGAQVFRAATGDPVHLDRTAYLRITDDPGPEALRVYGMRAGASRTVVAVAARRDLVDDAVQRSTRQLLIFGAIVILLAAPGSWLLARAALRPVDRMRAQAARLQAADAAEGVPVPRSRDELARLGATFNGLLGRLHAVLDREQAFVADAGHELRTPLTVLKGEFELAQRPGRTRAQLLETVDVAAEETDRLIRLTENLLVLAREGTAVPSTPVDLAGLASFAATAAGVLAAGRNVRISVLDDGVGAVRGDVDRLRQALDNLLSNAIRHSPAGGTVLVRLAREGADTVLEVADGGAGFPPEFLPSAFERFARSDDARTRDRGGSGLGLAIVAAIMAAHGGAAVAANRPDGGAVVTLRWPAVGTADGTSPGT